MNIYIVSENELSSSGTHQKVLPVQTRSCLFGTNLEIFEDATFSVQDFLLKSVDIIIIPQHKIHTEINTMK